MTLLLQLLLQVNPDTSKDVAEATGYRRRSVVELTTAIDVYYCMLNENKHMYIHTWYMYLHTCLYYYVVRGENSGCPRSDFRSLHTCIYFGKPLLTR